MADFARMMNLSDKAQKRNREEAQKEQICLEVTTSAQGGEESEKSLSFFMTELRGRLEKEVKDYGGIVTGIKESLRTRAPEAVLTFLLEREKEELENLRETEYCLRRLGGDLPENYLRQFRRIAGNLEEARKLSENLLREAKRDREALRSRPYLKKRLSSSVPEPLFLDKKL